MLPRDRIVAPFTQNIERDFSFLTLLQNFTFLLPSSCKELQTIAMLCTIIIFLQVKLRHLWVLGHFLGFETPARYIINTL